MHSLSELKTVFESNKIKIKEFISWALICKNGDQWTLVLGQFYKNREPMSRKQINDYIKRKGK